MMKLVRFTAMWCAPCRMVAPVLEKVKDNNPGVSFEVVDVDDRPEIANKYNIRSVPTVLLLKDEAIVETIVGAHPAKVYQTAIDSHKETG